LETVNRKKARNPMPSCRKDPFSPCEECGRCSDRMPEGEIEVSYWDDGDYEPEAEEDE